MRVTIALPVNSESAVEFMTSTTRLKLYSLNVPHSCLSEQGVTIIATEALG